MKHLPIYFLQYGTQGNDQKNIFGDFVKKLKM